LSDNANWVAELQRGGSDTEIASRRLQQFEEPQKRHLAHRERLRHELALLERSDSADHPLAAW
jgi:hypothetical protein